MYFSFYFVQIAKNDALLYKQVVLGPKGKLKMLNNDILKPCFVYYLFEGCPLK